MIFSKGYSLQPFQLDDALKDLVQCEKWQEIDQYFLKLTAPGGEIFLFLRKILEFSKIETMISVRDSKNEWEEDGIWHDDGSRVFAFSLSLNEQPDKIDGGVLELRKKNESASMSIPTPEFGTAILFLTGIHGFEHRTHQVKNGRRVMLVGWCVE